MQGAGRLALFVRCQRDQKGANPATIREHEPDSIVSIAATNRRQPSTGLIVAHFRQARECDEDKVHNIALTLSTIDRSAVRVRVPSPGDGETQPRPEVPHGEVSS